jgi:hypothetical protein
MKKFIFIFVFIFLVGEIAAQSDSKTDLKKIPTLNGHSFPSMMHFKSSFINTSIYAALGIGTTSLLQYEGVTIGDYTILQFQGKIMFVDAEVQYQQKINSWLALYLNFAFAGRMGTEMSTILVEGVNTLSGVDIGWLIKIKQSKKLNLSGSIYLRSYKGNFISVSKYVEDIINDVPDPGVTKNVPAMSAGAGLQGAYAFNNMFGLQAHAQLLYGEAFSYDNNKAFYTFGIVGDIDFNPRQNAPVGLAIGYTLSSSPQIVMSTAEYANIFMGKINYTGSDDFELGLQYSFYKVEIDGSGKDPSVNNILLFLKFYF